MKGLKLGVVACISMISTLAYAGNYQGYVKTVMPTSDGKAHVILGGGNFQPGYPSSCPHTSNQMIYTIDLSTAGGKAMFETALSANESRVLTFAAGNNDCAARAPIPPSGETETLSFIGTK